MEPTAVGINDFPPDVFLNIFLFCGDYVTLRRLGRTSSALRKVIHDKEFDPILWIVTIPCDIKLDGFKSYKDVARRLYSLEKIRREQKKTDNILITELGMNDLKMLLSQDFLFQNVSLRLTDMAVYGLTELVQANTIAFLQQELRNKLSRRAEGSNHLWGFARFCGWGVDVHNESTHAYWKSKYDFRSSPCPEETRQWVWSYSHHFYKTVRRLGYRAGIPEYEFLGWDSIYCSIWNMILELLYPVSVHHKARFPSRRWALLHVTFEDIEYHMNKGHAPLCLPYKKVYFHNHQYERIEDSESDIEMEMNQFCCSSDDDDDEDDDKVETDSAEDCYSDSDDD